VLAATNSGRVLTALWHPWTVTHYRRLGENVLTKDPNLIPRRCTSSAMGVGSDVAVQVVTNHAIGDVRLGGRRNSYHPGNSQNKADAHADNYFSNISKLFHITHFPITVNVQAKMQHCKLAKKHVD
jgi:hypothetical protein